MLYVKCLYVLSSYMLNSEDNFRNFHRSRWGTIPHRALKIEIVKKSCVDRVPNDL